MIAYDLKPPIEAWGQRMTTLEDAAYVVRKYAIESDDADARKLVRFMRDLETIHEASIAEGRLRAWLMTMGTSSTHDVRKKPGDAERFLHLRF